MERNKEPQRVFIYVNDDKAREEVENTLDSGGIETSCFDDVIDLVLAVENEHPDGVILGDVLDSERRVKLLDYFSREERYMTTGVIKGDGRSDSREESKGAADIYLSSPIRSGDLLAKLKFSFARKRRLKELDEELDATERKFSGARNMKYAVSLLMEEKGMTEDDAAEYLKSVSGKYGLEPGDAAGLAYDIFLLRNK